MTGIGSRPPTDDAFVELVHTAWPSLYRTGLLLVGEHALAEDLVQTALAKTYLHWNKVHEPTAARAYARRIMINTATSWSRRRSFSERPTEHLPDRPAAGSAGADQADRLDMVAALAQLPPRQRAVIVLRFYEDLSVRETAATLRISEGTVKSQTSEALAKLRALLGEDVDLSADAPPSSSYSTTGGPHA